MNPIARDLAALRHATRETTLDLREKQWLDDAGATWDVLDVEIFCSILEKVREVGSLYRDQLADEGSADEYVRKAPGEYGSLSGIAGSTYTGDEEGRTLR